MQHIPLVLTALPPGRVFGIDIQTLMGIGIQLFNTAVLAFALSRLLYNPVKKFMSKRTERIENQFATAQTDMAEAAELKTRYEVLIQEIESERAAALETARKAAAERGAQILSEAQKEAAEIRQRARADVEREFVRAKSELAQYIIDVSAAMTEKCIALNIDKDAQQKLFDETLSELEATTWLN